MCTINGSYSLTKISLPVLKLSLCLKWNRKSSSEHCVEQFSSCLEKKSGGGIPQRFKKKIHCVFQQEKNHRSATRFHFGHSLLARLSFHIVEITQEVLLWLKH